MWSKLHQNLVSKNKVFTVVQLTVTCRHTCFTLYIVALIVWYWQTLRDMLDSNGFTGTKIVAADGWWDISSYISTIPTLSKAVDVIG